MMCDAGVRSDMPVHDWMHSGTIVSNYEEVGQGRA